MVLQPELEPPDAVGFGIHQCTKNTVYGDKGGVLSNLSTKPRKPRLAAWETRSPARMMRGRTKKILGKVLENVTENSHRWHYIQEDHRGASVQAVIREVAQRKLSAMQP
jgi:hypothetical protein